MVEAQSCAGLVAKQGRKGAKLPVQKSLGPGPKEVSVLRKGLGSEVPGVK
jgi:hypothetical protein